jgi:hypothetical protein
VKPTRATLAEGGRHWNVTLTTRRGSNHRWVFFYRGDVLSVEREDPAEHALPLALRA